MKNKLGGLAQGTALAAVAVSLTLGLSACTGESSVPRGAQGLQPEDTSIPAEGGQPASRPTPARTVVLQGVESRFRVTATSVRQGPSFSLDGRQPEVAPAGAKVVAVGLRITNIGDTASSIEYGNPSPASLIDVQGREHQSQVSWSSGESVNPGMSASEVYTFVVPVSAVPRHLHLTTVGDDTEPVGEALVTLPEGS